MSVKFLSAKSLKRSALIGLPVLGLYACTEVSAITTLVARILPAQGVEVLAKPPIDHGVNGEAQFVDPDSREPITDFADLGTYKNSQGAPRVVRNNLAVDSNPNDPASVFYLLHITDFQIVDEESPGITPTNDFMLNGTFQGSYRPHSPYLSQTANAMIQAANGLATKSRPYDLAFHTGDAIENGQQNELDMFFTLMNGGKVTPDSGDIIDLIPGPNNDPNDVFTAYGLSTPWLSLVGNHDILAQGNFPIGLITYFNAPQVSANLIKSFGGAGLTIPPIATESFRRDALTAEQLYLMPTDLDDNDYADDQLLAGLTSPLKLQDLLSRQELGKAFNDFFNNGEPKPQIIKGDLARKQLTRCDYIQKHFADGGKPYGHGFQETPNLVMAERCIGHYAYVPENNPHLRVVTLDTTSEFGGAEAAFGVPQEPFNLAHLVDQQGNLMIDINGQIKGKDPKNADSVGFSSNALGLLTQPGTNLPLFLVPARQGHVIEGEIGDATRDGLAFLTDQLETAKAEDQMVIVASHHASTGFKTFNELRVKIEAVVCNQLNSFLQLLDCNFADGSMSTGNPGASVIGPQGAGNKQLLDLYAQIIGAIIDQPITSIDELAQAHLDPLAQGDPAFFAQLTGAFNLILSLRQILPDPVFDQQIMDPTAIRKHLAQYDNVVMHLAGHSHFHKIAAVCDNGTILEDADTTCTDKGASAGAGYYEIRTAANADWPQEGRILEFVDNNDGTLSIYGTVFAPPISENKLVETGRQLALADALTIPGDKTENPGDLNVELKVTIPEAVDIALDTVASRHETIESLTSLTK